jgi:hypothetical protein
MFILLIKQFFGQFFGGGDGIGGKVHIPIVWGSREIIFLKLTLKLKFQDTNTEYVLSYI